MRPIPVCGFGQLASQYGSFETSLFEGEFNTYASSGNHYDHSLHAEEFAGVCSVGIHFVVFCLGDVGCDGGGCTTFEFQVLFGRHSVRVDMDGQLP